MSDLMEPKVNLSPQPAGMKHRFHAMVKPVGSLVQSQLHLLLLSPQGGIAPSAACAAHVRRNPGAAYPPVHRGADRRRGGVLLAGRRADPAGAGLLRKVVALEAHYKKPFQRIENDLQTNGTLLDAEWAVFLKQHNFLVGLSCDGPKRLHDRYRVTKGGEPTHDKVMAAARLLQKHGVPFNALCVVNRENAKYPLDVYRFLIRELGVHRVQLIACVEPKVFAMCAAAVGRGKHAGRRHAAGQAGSAGFGGDRLVGGPG